MRKSAFIGNGAFYKGNTHAHTKASDGALTAEQIKELYKSCQRSFLAVTDHRVYGDYSNLDEPGFIFLPGVEIDSYVNECPRHVVGIGIPGENKFRHGQNLAPLLNGRETVQELCDLLHDNGNLPIVAHPQWSTLDFHEVQNSSRRLGLEIFNNVCELRWSYGNSEAYFTRMCHDGIKGYAFAADDIHDSTKASVRAFIGVKAASLTAKAITDSIKAGSFYASCGPEIHDFYVEDGKVTIKCSPAARIMILSETVGWLRFKEDSSGSLTSFTADVDSRPKMIRAIVVGKNNDKAYSQPIALV